MSVGFQLRSYQQEALDALSGTAVTRLAATRLTLRDIARIIGWSEARVEGIMARYVSADALAAEMLARMAGEQGAQTSDKPHT